MECRATPDLSESDVMLVDKQLNVRGRRLSAAFVLCLIQTLSAMLFVCQGRYDFFCKNDIHWTVHIREIYINTLS